MSDEPIQPAPAKAPASFASQHGNTAQIISALVAIFGFGVVALQVNYIRANAREAAARQVYMSYSEASLKYPEFVEPNLPKLKQTPEQYVRYKSFVAHMLFAYDEIFSIYDHPEWHRSFEQDVRQHMPYICFDMPPSDDAIYFEEMREILKEKRKSCPAKG